MKKKKKQQKKPRKKKKEERETVATRVGSMALTATEQTEERKKGRERSKTENKIIKK
jgi:hypothetical protein